MWYKNIRQWKIWEVQFFFLFKLKANKKKWRSQMWSVRYEILELFKIGLKIRCMQSYNASELADVAEHIKSINNPIQSLTLSTENEIAIKTFGAWWMPKRGTFDSKNDQWVSFYPITRTRNMCRIVVSRMSISEMEKLKIAKRRNITKIQQQQQQQKHQWQNTQSW